MQAEDATVRMAKTENLTKSSEQLELVRSRFGHQRGAHKIFAICPSLFFGDTIVCNVTGYILVHCRSNM